MKTEKKKLQGSALFTVVSVMAILILFLTGTLALATASNNRAHKSYQISQADYTAKAAIRSFQHAVQDQTANGANLRAAMNTLAQSTDADLTIPLEFTLNDTTMGNVGFWDPTSDPANPTWVSDRIVLSHVPGQSEWVFDETDGRWEAWPVVTLTATCRVGREEETVNVFISMEHVDPITTEAWKDVKVKVKGGGGSEVKGLQEAGSASFANGGNIYGGLGVNLSAGGSNDLIVLDNRFTTNSPLNFINGDAYLKTNGFNINVDDNAGASPASATVITGSFIAKNDSWIHVNYTLGEGETFSNKDIPYLYVGGVLASPSDSVFPLVNGNKNPFNVYAGTLYCPGLLTANADMYLMDKPSSNTYDAINTGDGISIPEVQYGHNTLGRKDGPSGIHLYNWASDTLNRRNDDYSFGGSIYCNGDLELWNAIIEGDVRVKGKLSINGNTRIKGDIVVENAYENAGKEGAARTSGLTFANNATQTSVRQGMTGTGRIYDVKGAGQVKTQLKEGFEERNGLYPGCVKVQNLKLENLAIEDAQVEEGKYMYNGTVYDSKPYFRVAPTKTDYAEGEFAPAEVPAVVVTDQYSYFQLDSAGELLLVDEKPVATYAEYTLYDEEGNETEEDVVSGKHYVGPDGKRATKLTDAFEIVYDSSNPSVYDVATYPYQVYPDEMTREKIYGVGETNAGSKTKIITTLTDVRKGLNMDVKTGYFDDKIYTRTNPYDKLIAEETDPDEKQRLQDEKAAHTLTGTLNGTKTITRPKDGAEWYILDGYSINGDAKLLIADNADAGAATSANAKYKGGIIRFYIKGTLTLDNRSCIQLENMPATIKYTDDFGIEYYSGGYVYDPADSTKKDINTANPGGTIDIHNQSMLVGSIKAPYLKLKTNNSEGRGNWKFTYESEKGTISDFYPTLIGNALVDKLTEAQNGFNLCFTKSGSGNSGGEGAGGDTYITQKVRDPDNDTVFTPDGRFRFTYCS